MPNSIHLHSNIKSTTILLAALFSLFGIFQSSWAASRPKVLLIIVDELNNEAGCYGSKSAFTLRLEAFAATATYQQGLLYFLARDPQVPKELQERVAKFGLDPREFKETGHWPHQLYIREGRRMVSDYVVTQAGCEAKRLAEDSVGLASCPMDSHFCQRVVVEENGKTTVRNGGGFGHHCAGPYRVAQSRMENARITVTLGDGTQRVLALRNPETIDDWLGSGKGTPYVLSGRPQALGNGTHAVLQEIDLGEEQNIVSLILGTFTEETLVGLLGVTLLQDERRE